MNLQQGVKFFLANEQETIRFAEKIAPILEPGEIILMHGELGAGKTTFARGIVSGLGGDPEQVHSPTFSIVHEYICPTISINHCDFYRLALQSDLAEFGGLEFFDDPKIYLLEWPERISLLSTIASERLSHVYFEHDASGRNLFFPEKWKILD